MSIKPTKTKTRSHYSCFTVIEDKFILDWLGQVNNSLLSSLGAAKILAESLHDKNISPTICSVNGIQKHIESLKLKNHPGK
jgi:hypothetical protein